MNARKLDTQDHAAYRARILLYGQEHGDRTACLESEVARLTSELEQMTQDYLDADAELWELQRKQSDGAA